MASRLVGLVGLVLWMSGPAHAQGEAPKSVDQQVADLIASMEKSDYAGKGATDKLAPDGKESVAKKR